MSQEEFGKLIKRIRKENNLTQKDLAEKYNVTYQAVSKWENGKNMPDISLIKQISKDFNISIDDMIDGKYNKTSNKMIIISTITIVIFILLLLVLVIIKNNKGFEFKTITSNCDNFNITGSVSYDDKKSVIYISSITYCGKKDDTIYKKINCSLFENINETTKEISKCIEKENITLDDFLKDTNFHIDNNACKTYKSDHFHLEIYATKDNDETILYNVPMKINDVCNH